MTDAAGAVGVAPAPVVSGTTQRPGLTFAAAFVPLLLLYAYTRARTVTGEDSGELISAAWTKGIAHPPGYPIWILLTNGFQQVFDRASPASAANLGSAFTTAAALGLLAVVALRLTRSLAAALFGSFLVAAGHEIWNHATIAEVYPLNLLVLAASLLLFLRWREKPTRLRFFALTLVYGCGIANHPTFQLFLPLFGIAVLIVRPRILMEPQALLVGILGLALPLIAYIQVWIAASGDPFVAWGVEPTFQSVLRHFNRGVYDSGPPKSDWTLAKAWSQAGAFARFHIEELTLPGWLAGIAGLVLMVRQDRLFGGLVAAIVLAGSFGMLPVLKFDVEREEFFTARVFLMPAYLGYGLGLAFAARWAMSLVPYNRRWALATAVLLLPVLFASVNFSANDRSRYFWAEDYGREILERLPKDAILFPGGDTSTFPAIYLQSCERVRRDVLIIDRSGMIERDEALAVLPEAARKDLATAPTDDLVDAVVCLAKRPVVMLRRHNLPGDAPVTLEPFGLGHAAVRKNDPKGLEAIRKAQSGFVTTVRLRNESTPTVEDYTSDMVRSHLSQVKAAALFRSGDPPGALREVEEAERFGEGIKETYNNTGALLAENGHPERAIPRFRRALSIRGDYHLARRNLVLTLRRTGHPKEALEEAAVGLVLHPGDRLLFEEGVLAAREGGDDAAVRRLCARRSEVAPNDPSPDRHLGQWSLDHGGSVIEAQGHFQAALAKDQGDRESKDALDGIDARLGLPPRPDPAENRKDRLDDVAALLDPTGSPETAAEGSPPPAPGARGGQRPARSAPTTAPNIPGSTDLVALLRRFRSPEGLNPLSGTAMPATLSPGASRDAR